LLASGLIVPAYYSVNARATTTSPLVVGVVPICDYISNLFKFWRGPIDVKLTIVASPYATGKLLVTPMYGYYGPPITYGEADSQFFEVIDLSEKVREYKFRWNFPSNTAYKSVTSTHKDFMSAITRERVSPGSFYIFVVNDYRVGEGIPTSAEVFISVSIPEVQLAYYNPQNIVPEPVPLDAAQALAKTAISSETVVEEEPRVQNMGDPIQENETNTTVLQGTGSQHKKTDGLFQFTSLRDLLKKQTLLFSGTIGTAVSRTAFPMDVLFLSTCKLRFISCMYAARIGGFRFFIDIIRNNNRDNYSNYYTWIPGAEDTGLSLNSSTLTNAYNTACGGEGGNATFAWVESSYTTQYNFMLLSNAVQISATTELLDPVITTNNRNFTNEGYIVINKSTVQGSRGQIYCCMDDHARMGLFVGVGECSIYDYDRDIFP
jgi:hypothetical protein